MPLNNYCRFEKKIIQYLLSELTESICSRATGYYGYFRRNNLKICYFCVRAFPPPYISVFFSISYPLLYCLFSTTCLLPNNLPNASVFFLCLPMFAISLRFLPCSFQMSNSISDISHQLSTYCNSTLVLN